jgi:hypothetical protein
MFKILSTYICWKKIYRMQHLEGSGTPVLYIGRFLKVNPAFFTYFVSLKYYIFFVALRPNAGHGLLILEVSRSHTTAHHSR